MTSEPRRRWDGALFFDEERAVLPSTGGKVPLPLLAGRDGGDRAQQKEVWRILGNPGVLLLDGEIVGVWRAKAAGRKRVDLTVTSFVPLPAARRKQIEAEAAEVARGRDIPDVTVTID